MEFEVQTNPLIPTRKPELVLINKKNNFSSSGFNYSNTR